MYLAARGRDANPGPWRVGNRPSPNPIYGLVRLEIEFESARAPSDATMHVQFGPARAQFPFSDVGRSIAPGRWSMTVHCVSHLLPNGLQPLKAFLRFTDGFVVAFDEAAFDIDNRGALAKDVRQDLDAHGTPTIFGAVVDSSLFPHSAAGATAWFDQPQANAAVPLSAAPSPTAEAARKHLIHWGFAILPDIVPRHIIDGLNAEVDQAIAAGELAYRPGSSDRIHGTHKLPHGRKIWLYPPVLDFLRTWFRDEPCACQTLFYINGSEQPAHQDTIHLTPFPSGYMCGVWVPLEDVKESSGELFVYPGSHRAPRLFAGPLGLHKVAAEDYSHYVRFSTAVDRLLDEGGYQRLVYRPQAGQILIWHENLIHGGHVREDRAVTRRSIVSHYFARGSVAYYDSRGEAAALEALK